MVKETEVPSDLPGVGSVRPPGGAPSWFWAFPPRIATGRGRGTGDARGVVRGRPGARLAGGGRLLIPAGDVQGRSRSGGMGLGETAAEYAMGAVFSWWPPEAFRWLAGGMQSLGGLVR